MEAHGPSCRCRDCRASRSYSAAVRSTTEEQAADRRARIRANPVAFVIGERDDDVDIESIREALAEAGIPDAQIDPTMAEAGVVFTQTRRKRGIRKLAWGVGLVSLGVGGFAAQYLYTGFGFSTIGIPVVLLGGAYQVHSGLRTLRDLE